MQPLHIATPLIESLTMSQRVSANIWLKMEALQPSGSFKIRGIGHACQQYVKQGAGGRTHHHQTTGHRAD